MQNKTRLLLMALSVFCGLQLAVPVCAQQIDETKARKVKAAYLYNFAKFIEWPDVAFEDEESPFVICVLGDEPFERILDDTVRSKTVGGRTIKVRRFRWHREEDRTALKRCHVLYVSRSERHRFRDIIEVLDSHPVLVVSDINHCAVQGGAIGFVLNVDRIVFEINREALERVRLRASSKLLALARIVETKTRLTSPEGKRSP